LAFVLATAEIYRDARFKPSFPEPRQTLSTGFFSIVGYAKTNADRLWDGREIKFLSGELNLRSEAFNLAARAMTNSIQPSHPARRSRRALWA
jgi:hypothetical protein